MFGDVWYNKYLTTVQCVEIKQTLKWLDPSHRTDTTSIVKREAEVDPSFQSPKHRKLVCPPTDSPVNSCVSADHSSAGAMSGSIDFSANENQESARANDFSRDDPNLFTSLTIGDHSGSTTDTERQLALIPAATNQDLATMSDSDTTKRKKSKTKKRKE